MFRRFYFAFVQFQRLEHAKKALADHRFPEICGAKCRLLPFSKFDSRKSDDKADSSLGNLFIKGLPKDWNHEDLCKAFEPYGTVVSAKVSIDAEHKSRGYGFVALDTAEAAQKAIEELNEKEPNHLSVSEYVRKSDRDGSMMPHCSTNLYVKNFPVAEGEDFTDD